MIAIDMEMPEDCACCRFSDEGVTFKFLDKDTLIKGVRCALVGDVEMLHSENRHRLCPLKELKPCFKGETTDGEIIRGGDSE